MAACRSSTLSAASLQNWRSALGEPPRGLPAAAHTAGQRTRIWGSPQVFFATSPSSSLAPDLTPGQTEGEMEELEDISITSLSETDLGRKRLYSGGSENSAPETEADLAAKKKSRSAAKRGKAHTLTSARAALRERVERDCEDGLEAALQNRAFCKQKEVGGHMEEVPIEFDDMDGKRAEELIVASKANLNLILGLAVKSVNLRGGYAAKIRKAAESIREVPESYARNRAYGRQHCGRPPFGTPAPGGPALPPTSRRRQRSAGSYHKGRAGGKGRGVDGP
ncbi:unnamed protein product [Euphydryas editha]|uniref:Uncharacterized protein n=1 Tax=Euphydryas editha TaxID=104508 RepID=A0AAU9TGL1_EUPED|nr:unnamed protein product [Euphydryas editha]